MKNLREAMERPLGRHHRALRQAAQVLASETAPLPATVAPSGTEPANLTRAQGEQAHRRERRLQRYQEIVRRYQSGMSIQAIGRAMQLDRRTVRRYVRAGAFPERTPRRAAPSRLDAFRPYLRSRWEAGCHNAMKLWHEIAERGFDGGPSLVRPRAQALAQPGAGQLCPTCVARLHRPLASTGVWVAVGPSARRA